MNTPTLAAALVALAITTPAMGQEACGPVVEGPDATSQACTTPINGPTTCHPPHQDRNRAGDIYIALTLCNQREQALARQLRIERRKWAHERRALREQVRGLRAASQWRPNVVEAITIASLVSGVPRAHLDRVVRCESGHDPNATNTTSGASGLVQYLPSTWAATTFGKAGLNRYSPYANAIQGALAMRHSMTPWAASRHCWGGR